MRNANRLTVTPGRPCLSRSRARRLRNGMTPAQVVVELPDLEEEGVRQALAYAAALAQNEIHPIRA